MHDDIVHTTPLLGPSSPQSVTQLTLAIKDSIEKKFTSICVRGEISNAKLHSSGHLYFDLKDSSSKISLIFFRFSQSGLRTPREGESVTVQGSLSLYPPQGKYQILVRELLFSGLGELLLQLEQLKAKLQKLGWFDAAHKKTLPKTPKTIGIITSPTGAVLRDMLHILRRRYPQFHALIYPVSVQGEGAAQQIAEAIASCNQIPEIDVLILARGGGSIEDLWAFNEEVVAKAIFLSRIPIVSAIGHETDVTLADFVADVRAPTPSAAAELVAPETASWLLQLQKMQLHLDTWMRHHLTRCYRDLSNYQKHPLLASPLALVHLPMQRLDELSSRLDHILSIQIDRKIQQLRASHRSLQALNPNHVLTRGYAILRQGSRLVTSIHQVDALSPVEATLADGSLTLHPQFTHPGVDHATHV